jgi:dTDP-4-dehydrorhamnose reductase
MKVGVTGAGGLLGRALVPLWRAAGAEVIGWTRRDLDVTDPQAVRAALRLARPDVVIHAAAWTDVDGAETQADAAMRVNRDGTAAVAAGCAEVGATVVYVSTDYVFDGVATAPMPPDRVPGPLGAYARSKAAGEAALQTTSAAWVVVRTGWVYGPGGRNFVDTMKMAAAERRLVRVVDDQVGAPTSARLIAEAVWGLLPVGTGCVWHVAAAGATSWFGVAQCAYQAAGAPTGLVQPCSTSAAARPAPRPAYSVLDCRATVAALGRPLPAWEDQVRAYVQTGRLPPCGWIAAAVDG